MWNDAQMVVVGGVIQGTMAGMSTYNQDGCNSSHPPLLVLDTTTFEWRQEFTPNFTYSQPSVLWPIIGGE